MHTKLTALFLALVMGLVAQAPPFTQSYYVYNTNATLSSAAGVWTIQQPTSPLKTAVFVQVYVSCSVACTFTLERDGTAATTTLETITKLNPNSPAPTMHVYSASDVGSGTVLGTYSLAAGGWVTIDLTGIVFYGGPGAQTGRNLTIRTSSISGNVQVVEKYYEQ